MDKEQYIKLLFDSYLRRKAENELYSKTSSVPKVIILEYLSFIKKPAFEDLIGKYKSEYIFCESLIENNMSNEEIYGLANVYDFIQNFNFNKDNFNIFTTSLQIHYLLYKMCGDGTFGGKLRETTAVLNDWNVEVPDATDAAKVFNSFISNSDFIFDKYKKGDIFGYINDCIKLNVALIKLQPFADGNKRTFRALLNLQLKILNIPPIAIEEQENGEYKQALYKAITAKCDDDYNDLFQFYLYKICDSIIRLDINNSKLKSYSEKEKYEKKLLKHYQ